MMTAHAEAMGDSLVESERAGPRPGPTAPARWLVLGTAQLGLPYGRRHREGVMSVDAAFRILDAAWERGVRAFDTAEAYGESVARLARWLRERNVLQHAAVVTKVVMLPARSLRVRLAEALERFAAVGELTLLSHGPASADEWGEIAAKARAHGARAGQSVYTAQEVTAALQLAGLARLQVPGNVFSRGALAARGDAPVALDIRSVYLQGLLLETPERAEARVAGAGTLALAVHTAAAAVGVAPNIMLVAAMIRAGRSGDRLVLGVDAPEHLDHIGRAAAVSAEEIVRFTKELYTLAPATVPQRLLDPRLW